ncbi:MAG: S1 family peptidase [Bdellovibrionia bacterium]
MLSFRLLLVSALLLSACEGQLQSDIQTGSEDVVTSPIVGGEVVSEKHIMRQYVVGIRGFKEKDSRLAFSFCTGAFVADNVVITAAHCFGDREMSYQVVYGNNLKDLNAPKSEVERVLIHGGYSDEAEFGEDNDLALVKIVGKKPSFIKTLELLETPLQSSFNFTAIGYGATHGREDGTDSEAGELRIVSKKALPMSSGKAFFRVDQNAGQGVCSGDSGGPAIVEIKGRRYISGVAVAVYFEGTQEEIEKRAQLRNRDYCQEMAYYHSVPHYFDWIVKGVARLI